MRMEQRQLLTPRMIQSMEILQLPLMALEERIEQELQNNPVLEQREGDADMEGEAVAVADQPDVVEAREDYSESEQPMVVKENSDQSEDFERLAVGTEVRFTPQDGDDGPQASSVQIVAKL